MLEFIKFAELKRFIILPLLMAFVAVALLFFGRPEFTVLCEKDISPIEEGWSIFRGVNAYRDIRLSDYSVGRSKKGETIITRNTINVESTSTAIMFVSKFEALDVYLDDNLVYTYGREYLRNGSFVPKKYNIIPINAKPGTHDLLISYTFSENNAIRRFLPIFYGKKSDLVRSFYSHHRISIFIGAFLIIYSCLFFSLWIYLKFLKKNVKQIYIGAFFSMLLGCYIFGRNDIFCFIGNHEMLFSLIEYTSFYIIPLSFCILLYSIHSDEIRDKLRVITAINIVFPIIIFLLHIGGIAHANRFLNVVGIIDVIEIIVILPSLIFNVIAHQKARAKFDINVGLDAEFYLFIGFIIMAVMSLIEIGSLPDFRRTTDMGSTDAFAGIHFLELGMLYFVMCHFIYYFMNSINHMSADRIRSQLEGLAYTDSLTGLMNRAALNQFYGTLSGQYGIVSIDLDRLKVVNDEMGHGAGDRMIKVFSDILAKTFKSANIIARTGGDEFIAVFINPDEEICHNCMEEMLTAMQKFNTYSKDIQLSASVGFAFSYEVKSGRYQDVFYLADQRMYKMKEAHHG